MAEPTEEYTIVDPGESTTPVATIVEPGEEEVEEVVEPTTETTEPPTTETSDEDVEEPSLAELSDEDLSTLIEAYEDKILTNPKLEERLQRVVQAESARLAEQTSRGREVEQELAVQIQHGRTAISNMAQYAAAAQDQLKKAAEGEPFETNIFNPDAFLQNLQAYGQAISSQRTSLLMNASSASIEALVGDALPELSYEQAQELAGVFNKTEELRKDPNQAANADGFLIFNLMRFVADQASSVGAGNERNRQEKLRTVADKVTTKNAVAVAKAQIEKTKNPPPVGGKTSTAPRYTADLAGYEKAKADGNIEAAQAIVDRMSQR